MKILLALLCSAVFLYVFSDHYGHLVGMKAAHQATPAQDQKALAGFNLNKRESRFAQACVKASRPGTGPSHIQDAS